VKRVLGSQCVQCNARKERLGVPNIATIRPAQPEIRSPTEQF
jgi:hypothetical protein